MKPPYIPVVRLVAYSLVSTALIVGALTQRSATAADAAKPAAPDLTGTVRSKDGQAISNASVFIYTAGPRVGPGYI